MLYANFPHFVWPRVVASIAVWLVDHPCGKKGTAQLMGELLLAFWVYFSGNTWHRCVLGRHSKDLPPWTSWEWPLHTDSCPATHILILSLKCALLRFLESRNWVIYPHFSFELEDLRLLPHKVFISFRKWAPEVPGDTLRRGNYRYLNKTGHG